MQNIKQTFKSIGTLIIAFAILFAPFLIVSQTSEAQIVSSLWSKGANGELYTNLPGSTINVGGCNGCGGAGGQVNSVVAGDNITVDSADPANPIVTAVIPGTDTSAAIGVRVATVAILPNTPTYNNGTDGVGATLTGSTNGTLNPQDGITLILTDRVLVKDQANEIQNGVYNVSDLGSVGTPYILTRTTDSDETEEFEDQIVIPTEGTQVSQIFGQTQEDPTLGTSDIIYTTITADYVTQSITGSQNNLQLAFWTNNPKQLRKGNSGLRAVSNVWANGFLRLGRNTQGGKMLFRNGGNNQDNVVVGYDSATSSNFSIDNNAGSLTLDSVSDIAIKGVAGAGFTNSFNISETIGGVFSGAGISHIKDSTGEIAGVVVADATSAGQSDVFASIGYNTDTFSEFARAGFSSGVIRLDLLSLSGGSSGTDEVANALKVDSDQVELTYENIDTPSITSLIFDDLGARLNTLGKLSLGDANSSGNKMKVTIDDADQSVYISGDINPGFTDEIGFATAPVGFPVPGTTMAHIKNSTQDTMLITVGDGTALGLPDMMAGIAYLDDLEEEGTRLFVIQEGVIIANDSITGGTSGTDEIAGGVEVLKEYNSMIYQNITQGYLANMLLGGSSESAILERSSLVANAKVELGSTQSRIRFLAGTDESELSLSATQAILKFADGTNTASVDINATSVAINHGAGTSYNLPNTRGTNGQILETNGAGGTNWVNANQLTGYTVATLPTATVGARAYVTDADTPTYLSTVVGGGAVIVPVFYNGTNWIVS